MTAGIRSGETGTYAVSAAAAIVRHDLTGADWTDQMTESLSN